MKTKEVKGLNSFELSRLSGTDRWYYQTTEITDLYDLSMMKSLGLKGSEIVFVSYPDGEVIKPFEKSENIYYDKPIYFEKKIYFIKVDFGSDKISVLKLNPETKNVDEIVTKDIKDINLYNITLHKSPIMLTSQSDNEFCVYYPEEITIKTETTENFLFRDEGKFYFSSWGESGVMGNGILGDDYEYFEDLIIRDKEGNLISKSRNYIKEMDNGEFWIL